MMKQPLITIAMVTYNSSKYIEEAISSVLASSYGNIELLICDDNSTDNTWERISTYKDNRIVKIRNEKNLGEYPNRNKCIDLAKGEYLLFIDGDDMVYPHGIEFAMKMLVSFPDCAMGLMTWYRNYLYYPVVLNPHDFSKTYFLGDSFLNTAFSNVIFKTNILREFGGLPNKYLGGDTYIRVVIGMKYSSLLINDGLTWWRETPGQASSKLQTCEGRIRALEMNFDLLSNPLLPLNIEEHKLALENLNYKISKMAIAYLRRINLVDFFTFLKTYGAKRILWSIFNRAHFVDPLQERYSPINPMRVPLEKNPYFRSNETYE